MQTLTDKEIETLLTIIRKGPRTGYDLHLGGQRIRGTRKAIMSSAYWLKVKKSLGPEGKQLIKLVPEQAKKKHSKYSDERGRRKDVYDLTHKGLTVALGAIENLHDLETVVSRYKDSFLIFQEWETFKKAGVEKEILKSIKRNRQRFLNFVSIYDDDLISPWGEHIDLQGYQQNCVDNLILGIEEEMFPVPPGAEFDHFRQNVKGWREALADGKPRDETVPDYERIWFEAVVKNKKIIAFCIQGLLGISREHVLLIRQCEGWLKSFGVCNEAELLKRELAKLKRDREGLDDLFELLRDPEKLRKFKRLIEK